jgi:hypothetical protein
MKTSTRDIPQARPKAVNSPDQTAEQAKQAEAEAEGQAEAEAWNKHRERQRKPLEVPKS